MGFLKDLSADISQAVEELIPKELLEGTSDNVLVNTLDDEKIKVDEELVNDYDNILNSLDSIERVDTLTSTQEAMPLTNDSLQDDMVNTLDDDSFGKDYSRQINDEQAIDAILSDLEEAEAKEQTEAKTNDDVNSFNDNNISIAQYLGAAAVPLESEFTQVINNIDNESEQVDVTEPIIEEQAEVTEPIIEEQAEVAEPIVEEQTEVTEPIVEEQAEVAEPIVEEQAEVAEPIIEEQAEVTEPIVEQLDMSESTKEIEVDNEYEIDKLIEDDSEDTDNSDEEDEPSVDEVTQLLDELIDESKDEKSFVELNEEVVDTNDKNVDEIQEALASIDALSGEDINTLDEENEESLLSGMLTDYIKTSNKSVDKESKEIDMANKKNKQIDDIISSLENIENGILDDKIIDTLDDDKAFDMALTKNNNSNEDINVGDNASSEVTVITKGTTVGGGIKASGSLEIYGTVNGDVECSGKLTILGNVTGSANAAEIFINTTRFEGDISCKGPVKIGVGTVVIGDVSGTSAIIAGAIKGEVDISGPVILESTSVVKGNVKGKSVQVSNGAVLQGFCSLAYADVDIDEFFETEAMGK